MPLAPISIQLSNFQQIEILRDQIEQFEEELKKTESRIRDVLYQVEKQRYLRTVHSIFQQLADAPDSQALPELHVTREALADALDVMKTSLASLEATSGPTPPRSAPPLQRPIPTRTAGVAPQAQPSNPNAQNPLRRNRFDAF